MNEIQKHRYEDFYDERIVPMLLDMDLEQYSYFSLGISFVMLAVSRAVIEGNDLLETMTEIETDAARCDREALATKMLMLGAFLDRYERNKKNRQK